MSGGMNSSPTTEPGGKNWVGDEVAVNAHGNGLADLFIVKRLDGIAETEMDRGQRFARVEARGSCPC